MILSVVIPIYKKESMVLKNLIHNMRFLTDCEIIIVDDDPKSKMDKKISAISKKIKIIKNSINLGFGQSMNIGISQSTSNYVFLLNSDVILQNTTFLKAISFLKKNKEYFAVSFSQIEKDKSITGKNTIYFNNGFIFHSRHNNINTGLNAWAEGGCSIVDKKVFNKLGGFDNLYAPFYWEDVDLSYKAYKAGYKVLFDSSIITHHQHESTIKTYFDDTTIKHVALRNQIIFQWKNITNQSLLITHIQYIAILFFKALFTLDMNFLKSFWYALTKLSKIMNTRSSFNKKIVKDDKEILDLFKT